MSYLNVGKVLKKTGLIGLISWIIGLVLTFVYVCYSGYIFKNDMELNFVKLFPNICKKEGTNFIKVDQNENGENSKYLLYRDLGKKSI